MSNGRDGHYDDCLARLPKALRTSSSRWVATVVSLLLQRGTKSSRIPVVLGRQS